MNLLFEAPELPADAWVLVAEPSSELELDRWLADRLDLAGGSVRRISMRAHETAHGWPLELATYETDGTLLVIAMYRFDDLVAAVAVGGMQPAWLRAHELEVAAALRAVEVDWVPDEPLTLRELWTDPVT